MARTGQVIFIALMLMSPAIVEAGPVEDANAVVDRWSAAFDTNDPQTIAKNYCTDAILLGTTSPVMSEGTQAIITYFTPTKAPKEPATRTRLTSAVQSKTTMTL